MGLGHSKGRPNYGRALALGLFAGLIVAAGCYLRNIPIAQLPKHRTIAGRTRSQPGCISAPDWRWPPAHRCCLPGSMATPTARSKNTGLWLLLAALAIAFPFFDSGTGIGWLPTIVAALIFCLQALGLNIVAGYAGLLDLGYVAFFAIGGYTAAFLSAPSSAWPAWLVRAAGSTTNDGNLHIPFWIIIVIAAAMAALFGLILGAPTLPLRGDYLAIVTLGFGEIIPIVFKNLEAVTIYEPVSRLIAMFSGNFDGGTCLIGCDGRPLNITNGNQGLNPVDAPRLPGWSLARKTTSRGTF